MTYTIRNEKTAEVLATVNDADLADWWKRNEATYFGVRVVGSVIEVADVRAWA
jgi:hypothetical protein